MTQSETVPVKRAFLYALVASIVLCATFGVFAVLSGNFGWFEIRILLTAATIGGASLCGLACGAYLSKKRDRFVPVVGVFLALVAGALVIVGVWLEVGSEAYWKLTASIAVFAVAFAHLALLSMARLAELFQWSLKAAYVVILGVASLIVLIICGEVQEEGMFRLLGVAAILDATITILIPLFHKMSRAQTAATGRRRRAPSTDEPRRLEAIDSEIARLKRRIATLEEEKSRNEAQR